MATKKATKEELTQELLELIPGFAVKEDHNIEDLNLFIQGAKNALLVKELQAENAEQKSIIEGLNQTLKELGAAKDQADLTVTVNKKVYTVKHGVKLVTGDLAGDYSADEISKNQKVAKLLVENGSSALELTKK